MRAHGPGEPRPDTVLLHHPPDVQKCRWIGHGRTRADHTHIITNHVRQNQTDHRRRLGVMRQPAAFDPGYMFAHGVQRQDVRPAFQQDRIGHGLVCERQPDRGPHEQAGGPAGQTQQDEVVGLDLGEALYERLGRGLAARSGQGMLPLHHPYSGQRQVGHRLLARNDDTAANAPRAEHRH